MGLVSTRKVRQIKRLGLLLLAMLVAIGVYQYGYRVRTLDYNLAVFKGAIAQGDRLDNMWREENGTFYIYRRGLYKSALCLSAEKSVVPHCCRKGVVVDSRPLGDGYYFLSLKD